MKFTRRQTRDILHFRKVLKRALWPRMKWEEYVSFYYYWKCYRYEYGGEIISLACYDNWKNHVSIKISERNPYKSRYYEIFSPKSKK